MKQIAHYNLFMKLFVQSFNSRLFLNKASDLGATVSE